MSESRLKEDQKQFRKLHKYLRQIEHLELLVRQLNEEELQKVAKRDEYRARLASAYRTGELSEEVRVNSIDDNSHSITETLEIVEIDDGGCRKEAEPVPAEAKKDENVKRGNRKTEKKSQPINFDTLNKTVAHADLITAVDICVESKLVVTGRFL